LFGPPVELEAFVEVNVAPSAGFGCVVEIEDRGHLKKPRKMHYQPCVLLYVWQRRMVELVVGRYP
jgi:hypothetical protein